MSNIKNNKRIFKNTLFLYFRMILTLGVSLYTSRVVLNILGVEDFGIYNVVGGVVTMMAFLSGAMSSSTQRFLSFEMGKNDIRQLHNVFKMSMNIHLLLVLIVILLAESLGVWFLNTQLVIPVERLAAANLVFHCALFSFCCTIVGVPYKAAIIAHEKMNAFAYISIVEVLLKLAMVLLLTQYGDDKLEFYALLLSLVSFVVLCCYYVYARWQFTETCFSWYWNSLLFKTLFGYTGWSLFGNLSAIATNQGINILLNLYFGATINAARAIAFQVNAAITGFVSSLQTAINPQIVKSYASDNRQYMNQLVISGSKYTFFLLYTLALPVLLQTDLVLRLWLVEPPQNTVIFCQLVLIDALITSLSGSLMAAVQATGRIKRYQVIVGGILLLNLPLSYLVLINGGSADVVFYVVIFTSIIALTFRLLLLQTLINLNVYEFINRVLFKGFFVVVSTLSILYFVDIKTSNVILDFIFMSISIVMVTIFLIYCFGLEKFERDFIRLRLRKSVCFMVN